MTGPPAEGQRVPWQEVPASVRAAVEDVCGALLIEARTMPGGFSPGVAARVTGADGRRWFVKGVSRDVNADTADLHRREAAVLGALGALAAPALLPVPSLHGVVDDEPWVVLVLEDVAGRHPRVPWTAEDVRRVVAALDRLTDAATPAPIAVPAADELLRDDFTGWRRLAGMTAPDAGLDTWTRERLDRLAELEEELADSWTACVGGTTLLHGDVRADNLLLTDDEVVVVDWPHACRGAAVVDVVLMAPSVAMQGGPEPAQLLSMSRAGREADPRAVTAIVCGLAGYFTQRSLAPPPPGLPTVRAFQAAQGEAARRWLRSLLD